MRFLSLTIVTLALFGTGIANATDLKRGGDLHQKNCVACHVKLVGGDGTALFTRADRRVQSFAALQTQVRRCKDNLGLTWFDEEVDDVAAYLNKSYYKFK
jgi:mono/diheme cytochrome c family protein